MIGVYTITNKLNGEQYVGSSIDIRRRLMMHGSPGNGSIWVACAFREYGAKNFKFEIVEECSKANLAKREAWWIRKLKPKYNRTEGKQPRKRKNMLVSMKISAWLHTRLKMRAVTSGLKLQELTEGILADGLRKPKTPKVNPP